jgi:hypothetical protein
MIRINGLYKLGIFIFLLILISCSATKTVSNSPTSDRDGSTKQRTIIVKSINAEYKWIANKYPGSKVTSQALIGSGKKHYDLLTFVTSTGETKKTYFDISSFFGKF